MLILDAIFAALIVKFFGDQGVLTLFVMLGVAMLRVCYKAEKHFRFIEQLIYFLGEDEEKEEV